jgi:N,N'-diacetyllegionaminate synthase
MRIGSIDTAARVYVIAEIGNNHEGDVEAALQMVRAAAAAGADAVKFQAIVPEALVSGEQHDRLAQLRRFQLSADDYRRLAAAARDAGAQFLSTPFSLDVVDWLDPLVPAHKVASGDNDFHPLIERLARTGKPLLISLGFGAVTRAAEVAASVRAAWGNHGVVDGELALLHCVSRYPTPDEDADLSALWRLRALDVTVGYSDHTLGTKAAELAVAAGARIVEKHFTLDRTRQTFRDHQLSADPDDFRAMVNAIRRVEQMLGSGPAATTPGSDLAARRSIAAARDLAQGDVVTAGDLTWVRPGSGFRPGQEDAVVGRRLRLAIGAGHLILPEHLV